MMTSRPLMCLAACLAVSLLSIPLAGADAEPVYANDLENEDIGFEPLDFLILEGDFKVKQGNDNRVLELPGSPIGRFGLLLGPTQQDGLEIRARVRSESKKRLAPSFGVGLNGVGGYKLLCSPNCGEIELKKNGAVVARQPLKWKSGAWTEFRLRIVKVKDGEWKIQGRLWESGSAEPKSWQVEFIEKEEPPTGRPAIWGTPFSDQPIQYDDLKVFAVKAE